MPKTNIIQPINDAGKKNNPNLLNQGNFISMSFKVNKLIIQPMQTQ
jgi:hypothetical protein